MNVIELSRRDRVVLALDALKDYISDDDFIYRDILDYLDDVANMLEEMESNSYDSSFTTKN